MNINEEMKPHKWAQDMADQKSSGLSQKEWCNVKGIPTNTFQYRCRQVRLAMEGKLKDGKADNASLVPANHNEEAHVTPEPFFTKVELTSSHNTPSGINIKFHDTLVNIAPDAPDSHVRTVLEVIADVK